MNKKNKISIFILLSFGLLFILGVFVSGYLFGSNIDWINQHTVFPEYFRNLFYETGNLFPQIAWNLGLGQNIYYFSYYGLLNPIILISYLFPFINMTTYIMLSSSILYLFSIYLFYKWIQPKYSDKTSFLLTFLFLTAGPLFYHFHRHIMFVNYFPFLLLGLLTIDKNNKESNFLLCVYIFLMIMCSYYYSIGGILVLIIYYFYKHYQDTLKEKIKILFPILIAVLLSGFLIIPTLYTILTSRSNVGQTISSWTLLLPNLHFDQILYGGYALGLTAITIPAILSNIIQSNKREKFLSICLFILILFPIFRYLLNGGLYIRSKTFIPFLPLFILLIGNFLEDIFSKRIDYNKLVKITVLLTVIGLLTGYFHLSYYLDLFFTLFVLYLCLKKNKQIIFYSLMMVLSFGLFIGFQCTEDFVSKKEYQNLNAYNEIIMKQLQEDSSVYRFANLVDSIPSINKIYDLNYYVGSLYSSTYSNDYYQFYHNILNSNNDTYNHLMLVDTNNIINHRLLGMKYILSKEELGWGYQLIRKYKDWYLYENTFSLPIGYATSNIYSNKQFSTLNYPQNLEMLLNGVVVEDSKENNKFISTMEEVDISSFLFGDNISISNFEEYSLLEVTNDSTITIDFEESINNRLLLIEIEGLESNSCEVGDIEISINGINNVLNCDTWNYSNNNHTFHYLINKDFIDNLEIEISTGTYKITDFNLYTLDRKILENNFDEMTNIQIKDNQLKGNINVSRNGYMVFSIPYDNGFTIKVDGEIVSYEKVNSTFLGVPISKGKHTIEITYQSPYFKTGCYVSIVGLILFLSYGVYLFLFKKNKKVDA